MAMVAMQKLRQVAQSKQALGYPLATPVAPIADRCQNAVMSSTGSHEPRSRETRTTRRRERGEGSVFFDHSTGLWVAEVTLGTGPDGKRQRKRVKSRDKATVIRGGQ